jgi:hypothetical protein
MPAEWNQESPDFSEEVNTDIATQIGKDFHLAPENSKELDLRISNMVNDTRPTIHLEIEWEPRNGDKNSINEPIEVN